MVTFGNFDFNIDDQMENERKGYTSWSSMTSLYDLSEKSPWKSRLRLTSE